MILKPSAWLAWLVGWLQLWSQKLYFFDENLIDDNYIFYWQSCLVELTPYYVLMQASKVLEEVHYFVWPAYLAICLFLLLSPFVFWYLLGWTVIWFSVFWICWNLLALAGTWVTLFLGLQCLYFWRAYICGENTRAMSA